MNYNKVILIGNITAEPQSKKLPNGTVVCSFSLATNKFYIQNNERKQKTQYHNIVCYNKIAENIVRFMHKGSQIMVEGELETREWDKDGVKQRRTEVVIFSAEFGAKASSAPAPTQQPGDWGNAGQSPASGDDIKVEDIPF